MPVRTQHPQAFFLCGAELPGGQVLARTIHQPYRIGVERGRQRFSWASWLIDHGASVQC
jgi:hypothetical protein